MKLERSFIETEDDGRFNWGSNGQTQVLIVNQNETNQYGEYRGYRSTFVLPPPFDFHTRLDSQIWVAKEHQRSRLCVMTWISHSDN